MKNQERMSCKLMDELMRIEGIATLPYESVEKIKRIICGTHNGVCSERFSGIKRANTNKI